MNWSSLVAPMTQVGGAMLGGLMGGPAAAVLGPAIGAALAEALGVPSTPEAVREAIANQPEAASIVRQVEALRAGEFIDLEARLKDTQDARAMAVHLAQGGSAIAWAPVFISSLIVGGFLFMTGALLFKTIPANEVSLVLFGQLGTAFGAVVQYWLGSSQGSRTKDNLLATLARPPLHQAVKGRG